MASLLATGTLAGCDAPVEREPLGEADADVEVDDEDAPVETAPEADDDADAEAEGEAAAVEAYLVPLRVSPELEGPCDVPEDAVQCDVDGLEGVQYCDAVWGPCVTEPECDPGDTRITTCHGMETEQECFLEYGVPTFGECGFTPLVMSFDGAEPQFAAAAASFELSAGDGACWAREMPTADTPWLALDLDGSGAIENGRELFGSASPMRAGTPARDGFEALREHDANHDGTIDAADPVWDSLLLWSDYDADRQSTAAELLPLAHSGVEGIELDHEDVRRCDDRGNCGIERAAFDFGVGAGSRNARRGTVIDVHIPCD